MSLLEETKKAMGYQEKPGVCENCKHFDEVENSHVDRMWNSTCKFSVLCHFAVNKRGTCSKFEAKRPH